MKMATHVDKNTLETVRNAVRQASRPSVLTGAGISAESGVPTFRGAEGLWKQYRSEDLATPEAFRKNPELVWEWYHWRRGLMAAKKPNPGHLALAEWEDHRPLTLITQNVDGLHRVAGSRSVLELHGSIWRLKCTGCGRAREDRRLDLPPLPHCDECGGMLRPDVVWFGESLHAEILEGAFFAASRTDLMLVVGTSAVVQPAASLAWQAKRGGALVVEINIERTPFSGEADAVLPGPSGSILPQLVQGLI